MELKQRKRIVNKYYGGKVVPDQADGWDIVNPEGHPTYLTQPNSLYHELGHVGRWNTDFKTNAVLKQPTVQNQVDALNDFDNKYGNMNASSSYSVKSKTNNGGSGFSMGDVVTTGVNFAGNLITDFNSYKREDELLGDSGQSQSYINGIGWQRQNDINYSRQMQEQNAVNEGNAVKTIGSGAAFGAAVGSIIPGLGTVAGGIIGGAVGAIGSIFGAKSSKNKLRKRIYNAQQLANRSNTYNSAGAFSKGLQQDYYLNNADTQGGVLYANKGKDLKKPRR